MLSTKIHSQAPSAKDLSVCHMTEAEAVQKEDGIQDSFWFKVHYPQVVLQSKLLDYPSDDDIVRGDICFEPYNLFSCSTVLLQPVWMTPHTLPSISFTTAKSSTLPSQKLSLLSIREANHHGKTVAGYSLEPWHLWSNGTDWRFKMMFSTG